MRESKTGLPTNPERENKPKLKRQIAKRILGVAALISTLGIGGDSHAPQIINESSGNISEAGSMPSQEISEEISSGQYCLFISGGMGTNAGVKGIKEGLERQYGSGNVEVFNSILSSDPQNPKRFEQMADFIQAHSKEGLDIVVHSLGAAELRKALKIVEDRNANFFNDRNNSDNLSILLIAPSGFNKGIKGQFNFLGRSWLFLHEQADIPIISKKNSIFRGIDALTAFPPVGISSKDLAVALRKAMPDLSQLKNDSSIKKIQLEEERDYSDKLTIEQQQDMAIYSDMMCLAIDNEKYEGLRSLVLKYGEKLSKPLAQVYAGNFEPEKDQVAEATKATIGGYIGMINILIDGFGSAPMKEIAKLQEKGISVNFIVPEYDFMMPLDEAIKFFNTPDEAAKHIKIAEGLPHSFPGLHKINFGEMVKNFEDNKKP